MYVFLSSLVTDISFRNNHFKVNSLVTWPNSWYSQSEIHKFVFNFFLRVFKMSFFKVLKRSRDQKTDHPRPKFWFDLSKSQIWIFSVTWSFDSHVILSITLQAFKFSILSLKNSKGHVTEKLSFQNWNFDFSS